MKKAILFLSTLLLLCGFACSQGVTVSGAVTGKVGQDNYSYFSPTDSVVLTNTTTQVVRKTGIVSDEATRSYSYSFAGVGEGEYTLAIFTEMQGLPASCSETVTVAAEDVTKDLVVTNIADKVYFSVKGGLPTMYGYLVALDSVLVVCTLDGHSDTAYATMYAGARFLCDINQTYTIKLHKDGYKDTVVQTKPIYTDQGSYVRGGTLEVAMQEDLGNQVSLSGDILIDGTSDLFPLEGMYLTAVWKQKTYIAEIKAGKYSFTDRIPVGELTFYLATNQYSATTSSPKNWKFNNGKDTIRCIISGDDGASVAQNLNVKRTGVAVKGTVVDTVGVELAFRHSVRAKVKMDAKDSLTNTSEFRFEGVSDGEHTVTFTAYAHEQTTRTFTVDMSQMKMDSVIDLGLVVMEGKADTFLFSGTLSVYDQATYNSVYLKDAKVVMFTEDGKKVDSATANEYGSFSIKVFCPMYTAYNFTVFSSLIKGGQVSTIRTTRAESEGQNYVSMSTFGDFELDLPEAEPTDHVFYGQLYYYGDNYSTVYLNAAKVMMFDAETGAKVDSATTDENGNFEITVVCLPTAEYNFTASHPDIDDASTTSPVRASYERNNVYIYCQAYLPCMESVKAEQVDLEKKVRLSWDWDQALLDDYYKAATGEAEQAEGTYEIGTIRVYRRAASEQYGSQIAMLSIDAGVENLLTEYVDTLASQLAYGETYTYYMEVGYTKPSYRTKTVQQAEKLTVTLMDEVPAPDSCTLVLEVNGNAYGTVAGAGKFPKGAEVTVKATANEGYTFVNWTSGETVLSSTAEYRFILSSDSTLTANFEAETVVEPDSVVLTLNVNNEAYGTVTGAGKFPKGEEVTVTATANTGYEFMAWLNGTDTASKAAEYKFEIEEDLTLTAVFAQKVGNEKKELAEWNAYVENGRIVLVSNTPCQYAVYSISGTLLQQGRMNAGRCGIDVPQGGLYLIRRVAAGVSVRKVVVR